MTSLPSPALPAIDSSAPRPRRDRRPLVAVIAVAGTIGLGFALMQMTGTTPGTTLPDPLSGVAGNSPHPPGFASLASAPNQQRNDLAVLDETEPAASARTPLEARIQQLIREARQLVKARQYDSAINLLTRQQALLKNEASAYLLIARALEGKQDYETARDFYNAAADKNPFLADAYWGYATSSEKLNDLESAIGGMRSFLHVEGGKDPYRLRVAQARSAIWEWESKLERGPWGPTKGIPPGFTEAEIRRDNRGVGIKMQSGTSETGESRAEMKHQDKIKIYPR